MTQPYDEIGDKVHSSEVDASARLREVVRERRDQRGEHARWGRLCEQAGEAGLALTEYQLALRDDPEDVTALSRLATLYEERGEADKAIESAERWVKAAAGDPEAVERLLELLLAGERFERAREIVGGPGGKALAPEARESWAARLRAAARAADSELRRVILLLRMGSLPAASCLLPRSWVGR